MGKPISGVEVKIIQCLDGAISSLSSVKEMDRLEIGEIIVKGKNISSQYWDLPDATIKSKIKDNEKVWHRMGDMGYLDSNGNIYFCGRKVHMVRTENKTYYSIPVERIFNQHPKVKRSALVSLNDGKEAGIVIEPLPEYWPESLAEQENFRSELMQLAQDTPLTREIDKIYFHRSFPVDARHNAKIFRDKLGRWASAENRNFKNAANA